MGKDIKASLLREADRLKRRVADINDDLDDFRGKVEEFTESGPVKPKPPKQKPGEKPPKKGSSIFEESDDDEPDDETEESDE